MKKILKKAYILYLPLVVLLVNSCSKDDPDGINEQEFISNVIISVTSPDGTLQTIDWDLSETNMETINLKANSNYSVGLSFENRSDPTDIEDVTLEIIDEADAHFEVARIYNIRTFHIKSYRVKDLIGEVAKRRVPFEEER